MTTSPELRKQVEEEIYPHFRRLKELFKKDADTPCEKGNEKAHVEDTCDGCKAWQEAYDCLAELLASTSREVAWKVVRAVEEVYARYPDSRIEKEKLIMLGYWKEKAIVAARQVAEEYGEEPKQNP